LVFDDHHKPCGLTSLSSWSFHRCISSSTTILKSTVRNTVDYSGQEKLFGKSPKRGPSGPLRRTARNTRVSLGQNQCKKHKSTLQTIRWKSKHRPRPSADCPASGADHPVGEEPKNPKVTGSVKWIIASSRTVRGVRPDRPRLPLSMLYCRWYSRYCWPLRFQPLMCRGGPSGLGARTVRGWQKRSND
jgi:hypothetical protein